MRNKIEIAVDAYWEGIVVGGVSGLVLGLGLCALTVMGLL